MYDCSVQGHDGFTCAICKSDEVEYVVGFNVVNGEFRWISTATVEVHAPTAARPKRTLRSHRETISWGSEPQRDGCCEGVIHAPR